MKKSIRISFFACAFWVFAFGVSLLPVGFGGNRPIPFGLFQIALAVSFFFLALSPDAWVQVYFPTRLRWVLGMLGALLVWAWLQTQSFMPAHWINPIWSEASSALQEPVHGSIAVAPELAIRGLTRLMTYIGTGFLAYMLARNPDRARQIVRIIWIWGTLICFYGFSIWIMGLHQILWFDKWAYVDSLTATFVSRNHFASYAGIILTCGIAISFQSWRDNLRKGRPQQRSRDVARWLITKGAPQAFLLTIVLVSIVLSYSRAGLTVSLLGVGSFLIFFQIYLRTYRRAVITAILILALLAAAGVIAFRISEHFAALFEDYSSLTRLGLYKLGWHIFTDNPWLGYGLNSFESEFRLYQEGVREEFLHAHSDVLEALIDLGLPAALLLWSAIGLTLSGLWHGIRHRRQNGLFPVLGLAVSVIALGHALVDFDLQNPGVAVTWAALLGTGLAQSWGSEKKAGMDPS